jgi:hypothetical protein
MKIIYILFLALLFAFLITDLHAQPIYRPIINSDDANRFSSVESPGGNVLFAKPEDSLAAPEDIYEYLIKSTLKDITTCETNAKSDIADKSKKVKADAAGRKELLDYSEKRNKERDDTIAGFKKDITTLQAKQAAYKLSHNGIYPFPFMNGSAMRFFFTGSDSGLLSIFGIGGAKLNSQTKQINLYTEIIAFSFGPFHLSIHGSSVTGLTSMFKDSTVSTSIQKDSVKKDTTVHLKAIDSTGIINNTYDRMVYGAGNMVASISLPGLMIRSDDFRLFMFGNLNLGADYDTKGFSLDTKTRGNLDLLAQLNFEYTPVKEFSLSFQGAVSYSVRTDALTQALGLKTNDYGYAYCDIYADIYNLGRIGIKASKIMTLLTPGRIEFIYSLNTKLF